MTARARDQSFSGSPGFDHGATMLAIRSIPATPRSDTSSPQIRIESEAMGSDYDLRTHKTLSSSPSARSLRSRRVVEDLTAENSRLRADVDIIRTRQAEALDKNQQMVTALVRTKSEMQAKNNSLLDKQKIIDKQCGEIESLRTSQHNTQDSTQLQKIVEQLTNELREKDLHLRERDHLLRERDFEIRSSNSQLEQEQSQHEKNTLEIQQLQTMVNSQEISMKSQDSSSLENERTRAQDFKLEIDQLRAAHATTLAQLDAANIKVQQHADDTVQSRAMHEAARVAVNTEKDKIQQYLHQLDQQTAAHHLLQSQFQAQDTNRQKLVQEYQSLQALHQKTLAESQSLEQLKASSAKDLADARRMANFFKKNSEATSREAKGLEVEIKSLMGSLQRNSGGAEERPSLANPALPDSSGFDTFETPGAWPSMDMNRSPSYKH